MLNLINGNTRKVTQSPEAETLWGENIKIVVELHPH